MKILLTGRNGQIGWELARVLAPVGEVVAPERGALDLAVPDQIVSAVRSARPDLIVNAAAYTDVDRAEGAPDRAMQVNGVAPGILAEESRRLGALLIHYSSDYVFDGTKPAPYVETDLPNPINAYGRSKLAGERAIQASGCRHLILRTSWVYGMRGRNFLLTILRRARELPELKVVDDQVGCPTWCRDLAVGTVRTINTTAIGNSGGLYHFASAGATSWCGFAREILRVRRIGTPLRGIPSAQCPGTARRPSNSRLSSARLLDECGIALPAWTSSLHDCLADPMTEGA
ncbi:MAG: dTDP-4-dehydrorhamnose reductase [Burkholderiales bacterium]